MVELLTLSLILFASTAHKPYLNCHCMGSVGTIHLILTRECNIQNFVLSAICGFAELSNISFVFDESVSDYLVIS